VIVGDANFWAKVSVLGTRSVEFSSTSAFTTDVPFERMDIDSAEVARRFARHGRAMSWSPTGK
jgi:hypothetical protein